MESHRKRKTAHSPCRPTMWGSRAVRVSHCADARLPAEAVGGELPAPRGESSSAPRSPIAVVASTVVVMRGAKVWPSLRSSYSDVSVRLLRRALAAVCAIIAAAITVSSSLPADAVAAATWRVQPLILPIGTQGGGALTYSSDGRYLAYPAANWHVAVVDARSGLEVSTLTPSPDWQGLAFSPDGTHLAVLEQNMGIEVFDVSHGSLLKRIAPPPHTPSSVRGGFAYIDHGRQFVEGGPGVFVVDAQTGRMVRRVLSAYVTGVAVDGTGTHLAVSEGVARPPIDTLIYSLSTWRLEATLPGRGGADRVAFYPVWSRDGAYLAASTGSGLSIYQGSKRLAHIPLSSVNGLAVGWLAGDAVVVVDNQHLEIWYPLNGGAVVPVFTASYRYLGVAAVSPTGSAIAVAALNGNQWSLYRLAS
jgi:hypothetical protein